MSSFEYPVFQPVADIVPLSQMSSNSSYLSFEGPRIYSLPQGNPGQATIPPSSGTSVEIPPSVEIPSVEVPPTGAPALSTGAVVVGSVGAAANVVFGAVNFVGGIYTLATDHPAKPMVDNFAKRLNILQCRIEHSKKMDKKQKKKLVDKVKRANDSFLSMNLPWEQGARGATQASGGIVQLGGGVTMIVGLSIGGPVTLAVGGIIGTVAGAVVGVQTLAASWRDYGIGKCWWKMTDSINEIEGERRKIEGLPALGRPCTIRQSASGWCQRYFTVTYKAFDGVEMRLQSCDMGYNWYRCCLQIEAGASDLHVMFDVRGGRTVFAVDRDNRCKWRYNKDGKCGQEQFFVKDPAGCTLEFELRGTSCHSYVSRAHLKKPECTVKSLRGNICS